MMNLWMVGIVWFGDGVRIRRRLESATAPATARAEGKQRDQRKGAGADFRAGMDWMKFCARYHEAAPVA
jgi:class 3 adenylate cyclase